MNVRAGRGHLACVGLGMVLGAHLSPRSRAFIEQADVVFVAASDTLVELWVQAMRPDVRSLQPYYAEGKARRQTYREMAEAILAEVRAGRRVCAAFYGHPGVFAQVPHDVVTRARAEGFQAVMEPGISAEACLYADLGIDPGRYGCQHYEATQFLIYRRMIDPSAYLVLWQIGLVGDVECRRYRGLPAHRQLLVERLADHYPLEHEVVVYKAATTPLAEYRALQLRLHALPGTELSMHSTLVVPPAMPLAANPRIRDALARAVAPSTAYCGANTEETLT